jgi:hypothetical protein
MAFQSVVDSSNVIVKNVVRRHSNRSETMTDMSEATIKTLLEQVNEEIQKIDTSILDIDSIIKRDIDELIKTYRAQLSEEICRQIGEKHFSELKEKKLDSYERARRKLMFIKNELQSSLANPAA